MFLRTLSMQNMPTIDEDPRGQERALQVRLSLI